MIAETTFTDHCVEETVTIDDMVQKLYQNGFTGGKYGGAGVYANTAWFDKTDKLQELFPQCRVTRLPNELITVIRVKL